MHVLHREDCLNKAAGALKHLLTVNSGQGKRKGEDFIFGGNEEAMRNLCFTSNITPTGQRVAQQRKFWCFLTSHSFRKSINILVHVVGENSVATFFFNH